MSSYRDLRMGAVVGMLWTGGGQVFRNVMSLTTSVVLARLLTPDDFGLFALTVLSVEFAQMFATAGFGASIVQRQNDDPAMLSTLYWTNIGAALLCAVLVAAAALPLAYFFRQPQLTPVLVLASLGVIISGATTVPYALLNMNMRFRDITMAQTVGSLSGALGAIALALAGAGVWALAAQPLIGSTVALAEITRRSRWWPKAIYQWHTVRQMMQFSSQLLAANFFGFLNRSAWAAIIGRTLGTQQIGLFNLGQQIVFAPIVQFSSVVMRVLFPTLAKLNDQPEQLRHVWLRSVGTVGFLTFPILAGLEATLPDFVPWVLGPQWLEVVPVLQVLCVVAMLQSVGTLAGSVLLSGGHGSAMMRISVTALGVMVISLLIGQHWGLAGVTWGFAIGSVFTQLQQLKLALHHAQLSVTQLLRVLAPTAGCTALAFAVAVGLRLSLPNWPQHLRLCICLLAGTVVYMVATWVFNRGPVIFLLSALRGMQPAANPNSNKSAS